MASTGAQLQSAAAEERAVRELVAWLRARRLNLTEAGESVRWLSYLLDPAPAAAGAGNHTDLWAEMDSATLGLSTASRYSGVLCFLVSTLFVFLLSLMLGLTSLRCWDLYIARAGPRLPAFLCSQPPSYDTVTKTDRTELPSYQQACRAGGVHKV